MKGGMLMKLWPATALIVIVLTLLPASVSAQAVYGQRLQSMDGQWLLPVATLLLCSDTGDHTSPSRGSEPAWDLCAPGGTPIFAATPGRVIHANCDDAGGYGCWVMIDHGNGYATIYAHMIAGSIAVNVGQQVDQWTVIGQVGWTGTTSFGPHTHFVLRKGGVSVDPAGYFSQAAMRYCRLCSSPAGDAAPRGVKLVDGQQATRTAQAAIAPVLRALAGLSNDQFFYLIFGIVLFSGLVFWLANNAVRVVMAAGLVATICSTTVVLMLSPVSITATSTMPASFTEAYQIVRGQEGRGCDTYIVRTLNGVTQWTYDRYRKERGQPRADVCGSLTEQEAQDIYYRYYWQPIGADGLSRAAAVQAFDHAINAGVGEGKRIIGACGNDAACIARQRVGFYNSTETCRLRSNVCGAWLRRVESVYAKVSGDIQ
jgi:hypothetical protein